MRKIFFSAGAFLLLVLAGQYLLAGTPQQAGDQKIERLSDVEEKELQDDLKDIVLAQTPTEALERLRIVGKTDPRVLRVCHDLAHFIGHEAMRRYGSFPEATLYQDPLCNSGYLHGAIEEYLSNEPISSSALLHVCEGIRSGSFEEWQCIHGIGHGLMFMKRHDLTLAISECEKMPTNARTEYCVNGVYMELFSIDGVRHRSPQLDRSDPMTTCSHAGKHVSTCALYAPTQYLVQNDGDYVENSVP